MHALSAGELLTVWEKGAQRANAQRALSLLLVACPASTPEDLARLSVGERDGRLLTLREWAFGPRVETVVDCPQCCEQLELAFDLADIRAPAPVERPAAFSVQISNYDVSFRLPHSLDLLALNDRTSATEQRLALLANCVLAATRDGIATAVAQLPDEVLNAVVVQMGVHDPQADVQISLTCPACGRQWFVSFDIVTFFWAEIGVWAHRVLHEVHRLACAYGWREADILAMSPRRRHLYLEMLGE